MPVAGVITKADAATPAQISQARELLELAGASPIFTVSARTGQGIPQLRRFLEEDSAPLSP